MFNKFLSTAAVAVLASSLVSAQTFTECDPTKKDCPPDPAFGRSAFVDFTKGPDDKVFKPLAGTTVNYDNGAVLSISKDTDAPTMASHEYIFFGHIEMELKAAHGAGIVTSVVLQSADLDEIDWEWVGGDDQNVQTNYFSKGDTSTYDRGGIHPVPNPTTQFHKYSIDWTPEHVIWAIDGNPIRTLTYAEAKGGSTFPQTPMQMKFGSWVAGREGAPEGTVKWAGGMAPWDQAPFVAIYKSINIMDYAGGSSPETAGKGAKRYIWTDKSGTWQSIKVDREGGKEGEDDSSDNLKTTTAIPTRTSVTPTTLSTVRSSTTESDDAKPTPGDDGKDTSEGGSQGSEDATPSRNPEAPAATNSPPPSAAFNNHANLALGAVGLFITFFL